MAAVVARAVVVAAAAAVVAATRRRSRTTRKWAAYSVTPAARGGAGAGAAGRGGRGSRWPDAAEHAVPQKVRTPAAVAHLELLNLATGDKVAIPGAASWKFSSDARWLAVKLTRTAPATAAVD